MFKALATGLSVLVVLSSSSAAYALTFTVANTGDSGAGSLRQAVLDANAAGGADVISFDSRIDGQAIVLTNGPLEISDSLAMTGPGPDTLAIRNENPEVDIVKIGGNGISVALTALALEGGEDGIQINAGSTGNSVALTRVRVARQLTDDGVSISGTLNKVTISDCVLEGSEDNISVEGARNAISVIGSTVAAAKQDGIEIEGDGNVLVVENSTVSNNGKNSASANDGIDVDGSRNTVRLNQITSSHNGEDGLDVEGPGNRVTIDRVTIAFNGRDGIKVQDPTSTSTLVVGNSLVAENNGPDVDGGVTSNGYNLIGDGTGSSGFSAPGDQVGTAVKPIDAGLGALQAHGGATSIHALRPGSLAINAGDPTFMSPPEFDQRGPGFPRVLEGRIDIGSAEGTGSL